MNIKLPNVRVISPFEKKQLNVLVSYIPISFLTFPYMIVMIILCLSARLFVLLGLIGGVMRHLDFQYISIVAWSYICDQPRGKGTPGYGDSIF